MTIQDDNEFVLDQNDIPFVPTMPVHIESSDVSEGIRVPPEYTALNTFSVPSLGNSAPGIEPGIQILPRRYRRNRARIWVSTLNGAAMILFATSKEQLSAALQAIVAGAPVPSGVLQILAGMVPTGSGGYSWDGQKPCFAGTSGFASPPTSGLNNGITATSAANAAVTATYPAIGASQTPVLTSASVSFSVATTSAVTLTLQSGAFVLGTYTLPIGTTNFTVPLPNGGLLGAQGSSFTVTATAAGAAITTTINITGIQQTGISQIALVTVLDESYASISGGKE
jgi:hypothetical protein